MSLIRTLYLIWTLNVSKYSLGQTTDGYVLTSAMGWFEARKSCIEDKETNILVPSETEKLDPSHVLKNTYYWVGGFETSEWIWADNSPLFDNIGLCDVPTAVDADKIMDMPYNSAFECYRTCQEHTIGLIGSKCYCLDDIDQLSCSGSGDIMMCFGNPEDQCGTESSMSVYTVDVPFNVDAETEADYQCAYSIELGTWSNRYIEVYPYDCGYAFSSICVFDADKDFARCNNELCVSRHTASWTSSNQSCSLAKFSFSRVNIFIQLQNWFFSYSYWIGLHKIRFRHWIDGKTEQLDFEYTDQNCLAKMKTDGGWSEYWIPCIEEHQSLCSSGGKSDHLDTTQETWTSSALVSEIPGTTSPTEERQLGGEHGAKENNGKIGLYVGVSVGCLLLLVIIGITLVLKRKGKFCFKRKEGDKTIAMDNIAYIYPNNLQSHDVIHGSCQSGNHTTNHRRPGIDNNRCPNEEDDDYDTTQAETKRPVNSGQHYDHLGAGDGYYDTAGVNGVNNVHDNTYDHTEAHGDPQRVMVDNSQGTYINPGIKVSSNELVDNDRYNHPTNNRVDNGSSRQDNETYSHLSDSETRKGTLDSENCYNHLVTDVDNDYDTTRPVIDNVENVTYDHTGEYQVTDDVKKNMTDLRAQDSPDYYNL